MLLDIYDCKTFVKLDLIRTFDFVQYSTSFDNVGEFTLIVPLSEKSLRYLTRGNFILFDVEALGIIRYRKKEDANLSYVTIKGRMLKSLTLIRSFLTTENYRGTIANIVREIVTRNFLTPADPRRAVAQLSIAEANEYNPESRKEYVVQYTGKKIHYGLQDVLQNEGWGYDVVPILQDATSEAEANIKTFELRILKPADRTIGNAAQLEPVVFSRQLRNLKDTVLIEDDTDFANVMIVAGAGEGTERTVIEVGEEEAVGLDRIEEYVDARDLQPVAEDGTSASADDYRQILQQRGKQKQQEHISFIYFDGTVVTNKVSAVYNCDYFVGDLVSVIDEELGIVLNVPVIEVTKSLTSTGEVLDVTFGYNKATVRELLSKEGVI